MNEKRKRQYLSHVTRLDQIYAEDQQRKKIAQSIENMKRLSNLTLGAAQRDRKIQEQAIQERNAVNESVVRFRESHPLDKHSNLKSLDRPMMNTGLEYCTSAVFRRKEEKRINRANESLAARIHSIKSDLNMNNIAKELAWNYDYLEKRNRKREQKLVKADLKSMCPSISPKPFKERVFKGWIFKNHSDQSSLAYGKQLSKSEIENLLVKLEQKREATLPSHNLSQGGSISADHRTQFSFLPKPRQQQPKLLMNLKDAKRNSSLRSSSETQSHPKLPGESVIKSIMSPRGTTTKKVLRFEGDPEPTPEERLKTEEEYSQLVDKIFPEGGDLDRKLQFKFEVANPHKSAIIYAGIEGVVPPKNILEDPICLVPWEKVKSSPWLKLTFGEQSEVEEVVELDLTKRHQKVKLLRLSHLQPVVSLIVV